MTILSEMEDTKIMTEKTGLLPEISGKQRCEAKLNPKPLSIFDKIKAKFFKNTQIVRFAFMAVVILIALFLLIYSSYLIAIQFLLNAAYRYNMKLIHSSQVFLEIDSIHYEFNMTCSVKNPSSECIILNLEHIKQHGVTDIILKNIFDVNYDLLQTFGDKDSFERLLKRCSDYKIGLYIDIPKIPKNYIHVREGMELQENDSLSSFDFSVNRTCLDIYKSDVIKVVEEYSKLRVDGFVINDLPCCVVYPDAYLENCSFESIYRLRKIARKAGKPSALIYRSKPLIDDKIGKEIEKYNFTFFDAVISYIFVKDNRTIKFTSKTLIDNFPQNIWSLRTEQSYTLPKLMDLYTSIWGFYSGASLYQPPKSKDDSNSSEDMIHKRFSEDLRNIEMLSHLKKILANTTCVSNSSAYVPDFSDENLFISVLPLNIVKYRFCVLVVNFGNSSADVNTRLHFKNYPSLTATGEERLRISSDGIVSPMAYHQKTTFTVPKMSSIILQIHRELK